MEFEIDGFEGGKKYFHQVNVPNNIAQEIIKTFHSN